MTTKKIVPVLIIVLGIGSIVFVIWYMMANNSSFVTMRKVDEDARIQTEKTKTATSAMQALNDCMLAVLRYQSQFKLDHPAMTADEATQLMAKIKQDEESCKKQFPAPLQNPN